MSEAIIDYGSGNLRSAEKAVERSMDEQGLNQPVIVTSCPVEVSKAARIILPGVGAFGDCIDGLRALDGMVDCLNQAVLKDGKPFLGICVGMQLLATEGHEHGNHAGLGWIKGTVDQLVIPEGQDLNIPHIGQKLKIPHMGWNQLNVAEGYESHPIVDGIKDGDHVYFVHSYQFNCDDDKHIMAQTEYGHNFPAIIGRDNIVGTQFHPEKSQRVGLQLLGNFLKWSP